MNHSHNPNLLWSQLFVGALAQAGLTAVCIAPGSRSTPLTLAFAAQPEIEVYTHLDERSAGFFALGMAVASDRPVALLCTSGTAAANFLPAIIEAKMSQVPLLVLTADRPPELRHSGANQTIDQVKMYGDQVLWSVDMALPQSDAPEVALRNVQATAVRAYATANGFSKGPVHLNFPFRKPLQPGGDWRLRDWRLEIRPQFPISMQHGRILPTPSQLDTLADLVDTHDRGLIVCGPRCPGGGFPEAAAALSRHVGFPILADSISGVRFGKWVADTAVLSGYETFLQPLPKTPGVSASGDNHSQLFKPLGFSPEIVIRFGAVPVSKWLNVYLDQISPAVRLHIRESGVWADDSHHTTHFVQANETAVCQQLLSRLPVKENGEWVTAVTDTEVRTWAALETHLPKVLFAGAVVADVLELLPPESTLFMGNSSPIRYLDQYGRAQTKPIYAYASRGASGIDGNLSTALGIHTIRQKPFVAILGDITFYHDLNGLLALRNRNDELRNITIVLLYNNGGSIFNRLPIANIDPPFTELFLTPHGLDFELVVRMYGLDFVRVDGRDEFRHHLSHSLQDETPRVIEVRTDNQRDEDRRREINGLVR